MHPPLPIGRRLQAYRKDCGLTQKELAERVGIAASRVANIEAGRTPMHAEELPRFARALHCDVLELLSEGEEVSMT